MELALERAKDTKNKVRYEDKDAQGQPDHIIYLSKSEAAGLGNPNVIKVTIEKAE